VPTFGGDEAHIPLLLRHSKVALTAQDLEIVEVVLTVEALPLTVHRGDVVHLKTNIHIWKTPFPVPCRAVTFSVADDTGKPVPLENGGTG